MAWPLYIGVACGLLAFAIWRRRDIATAAWILGGLFAGRLVEVMPTDYQPLAFAALWVGIGRIIAKKHAKPVIGGLLVSSGLCYLGVRIAGEPVAIGEPLRMVADAFGLLSMLGLAWSVSGGGMGNRLMDRVVSGRRRAGHGGFRRPVASGAMGRVPLASQKGAE